MSRVWGEFGKKGKKVKGSDRDHNRVSTYARITIMFVYLKRMMMVLCHCPHLVRASINV